MDRAARQGDVGVAGRLALPRRAVEDLHPSGLPVCQARRRGRGDPPLAGSRCRRRAGRPDRCDRSRAARHRCAAGRRGQHGQRRLARDLLVEAHARDPRPPGLRGEAGAKGRRLERRPGLLSRRAGLRIQPAARRGSPPAGVHQSAAVLGRAVPGRATGRACAGGAALAQQGRRRRAGSRPRRAAHQRARR